MENDTNDFIMQWRRNKSSVLAVSFEIDHEPRALFLYIWQLWLFTLQLKLKVASSEKLAFWDNFQFVQFDRF